MLLELPVGTTRDLKLSRTLDDYWKCLLIELYIREYIVVYVYCIICGTGISRFGSGLGFGIKLCKEVVVVFRRCGEKCTGVWEPD